MTTILVTGMSGTGKSTALQALAERGHGVDQLEALARGGSNTP